MCFLTLVSWFGTRRRFGFPFAWGFAFGFPAVSPAFQSLPEVLFRSYSALAFQLLLFLHSGFTLLTTFQFLLGASFRFYSALTFQRLPGVSSKSYSGFHVSTLTWGFVQVLLCFNISVLT